MVAKDHPADLINVALEELLRAGCELSGYATLDSMVARIRARYNTALFAGVQGRMAPGDRQRLERLLLVDLATISPYITRTIRRFGDYVLNLDPPDNDAQTKLELQPGALFPPTRI